MCQHVARSRSKIVEDRLQVSAVRAVESLLHGLEAKGDARIGFGCFGLHAEECPHGQLVERAKPVKIKAAWQ